MLVVNRQKMRKICGEPPIHQSLGLVLSEENITSYQIVNKT